MEREAIKKQLEMTEKVMAARMDKVMQEKRAVELKVTSACIKIQAFVRMKQQRTRYLAYQQRS
jgi:hypothetical protein